MQTTGLSSSHTPSSRNNANNSISEKPEHAFDPFDDVMHRALSGADAKPRPQGSVHSPFADEIDRRNESESDQIKADRKRAIAKKSEHRSADAQFTGMNGAPATAPLPQPNQRAGNAHDSREAQGSNAPVSADSTKAETVDAVSTDSETAAESNDPAAANDSSETPEALTATESSEHSPVTASQVTKDLAAQSTDPTEGVMAATAGKSDAPNGPIELGKAPVEPISASPSAPRGTSAAKQDMTMKKADKTPKVAGQTEQDLPGIAVTGTEEASKGQKLAAKDDSHGTDKLETASIEMPLRILSANDSPAPTVTAAAANSPTLDVRVLERTHDIVALHAMRLNDTNSDSLHVMVKPGAGIQLSLELRQSARGIEVHASLHKGDFEQLKQHWPDLQQRLEARGVRLGSLTTAENFTSGSHQQFQQSKQQSPNQDPLYAGAFAEFALAGSMTEAPGARAARATAYRGWETWA
jgi:hypothetical protein